MDFRDPGNLKLFFDSRAVEDKRPRVVRTKVACGLTPPQPRLDSEARNIAQRFHTWFPRPILKPAVFGGKELFPGRSLDRPFLQDPMALRRFERYVRALTFANEKGERMIFHDPHVTALEPVVPPADGLVPPFVIRPGHAVVRPVVFGGAHCRA